MYREVRPSANRKPKITRPCNAEPASRAGARIPNRSEIRPYVGHVPGFPGAHSQGETLEELNDNLKEVVAMLLDDAEPAMETEYIGTQTVVVA